MKPGLLRKRQVSTLAVLGFALGAAVGVLLLGMMLTAVLDALLE